MPSPTMLDGMRAPRSVRLEDMRQQADPSTPNPSAIPAAPGVTVYISNSRRYLVEIQNVPSYSHEGRKYPAKRLAAQFDEGVYRNDHRDPKVRAMIDEALQSNKYFGRFGDVAAHFWLASEQQEKTRAKQVESALKTLKSLSPETVKEYAAQLAQGDAQDHQLDAVAPAGPTGKVTRPIPVNA
jgi:hypothetical protein